MTDCNLGPIHRGVCCGILLAASLAWGAANEREPHSGRRTPFTDLPHRNSDASQFSLWANQGDGKVHSLYHNSTRPRRRIERGDLIHVVVDESAMASVTADTDLKRRFEVDTEIDDWVHLKGLSQLSPALRDTQPGIDFSSERRTQGLGRRNRRDRMTFRITAQVAWELGDGLLFITANKTMQIHDEESVLKLQGYIHRRDIDKNRMARSENVHDLQLSYSGTGALASNYTRSFWGWLLDLIWF